MFAKPHALHHDALKMAHHVVCKEEGAKLPLHFGVEFGGSHEHLVTVRPGYTGDFLGLQKGVDLPTGAAIAINNGNTAALAANRRHLTAQAGDNALGVIVP